MHREQHPHATPERKPHSHTQFTPQHNTFNAIGARPSASSPTQLTGVRRIQMMSELRTNKADELCARQCIWYYYQFLWFVLFFSLGTSFLVKICFFFVALELELEIRFVASTGCGSLSCDLIIYTCLRRYLRENVFSCELVTRAKISNGITKYLVCHMIFDHGRTRSWSRNMFVSVHCSILVPMWQKQKIVFFSRASGFHNKEWCRGEPIRSLANEANFRHRFP